MFVKKQNSDIWYATTVKWNKNELQYHHDLSLGIHFEHMFASKNSQNPIPLKDNLGKVVFVSSSIPFNFNFGEHYTYMFRFVEFMLSHINSKEKNNLRLKFATSEEYNLYKKFYNLKQHSCYDLINFLKNKYNLETNTSKQSEIILATDRKIFFNPFASDICNKTNGIQLLPT